MTCYKCEHFDPKTKICDINNDEILNPESNTKCDFLNESFKELKVENARLRKALQEIAEFASECEKRIPAPTLEEICLVLRNLSATILNKERIVACKIDPEIWIEEKAKNNDITSAALRVWLKMKGLR